METNAANIAIFCLLYLVLPGAFLVRAFRFPREAQLVGWATTYHLELTDLNRPVILAYLRRTRRFRVVPAAITWMLSGLPLLTGEPLPFGLDIGIMLYAYFAGAALAVLTMPGNRPASRTRHARLQPRVVDDYLATHVRRLLWVISALVLALLPIYAAVAAWASDLPGPRIGDPVLPVGAVVPGVFIAVAIAVVTEFAQRRVVARPQPATSFDVVAADDAMRAASVAAAAGAGVVVVLGAFAGEIEAIAALMESDWLRWPLHLIALGAVLLAWSSFLSAFRPEPWWFGRHHAERTAV